MRMRTVVWAFIFGAIFWLLLIVGIRHFAHGAEAGQGLEPRIIMKGGSTVIEVWNNTGDYKYKVWDNRPGPMKDESEYILDNRRQKIILKHEEEGNELYIPPKY